MLCLSAILRGHPWTKFMGILVAIPYVSILLFLAIDGISNWRFFCDYWQGNLYERVIYD